MRESFSLLSEKKTIKRDELRKLIGKFCAGLSQKKLSSDGIKWAEDNENGTVLNSLLTNKDKSVAIQKKREEKNKNLINQIKALDPLQDKIKRE